MSAYIGKKPVDVLNYDHWTDTAKYTSRTTADGLEIIDGRLARVKKIQGDTVKSNNLFYTNVTSVTQYGVTTTFDSETQEFTMNGTVQLTSGTVGFNVILANIPLPIIANKKYTVARIKTGGSVTFGVNSYFLWSVFTGNYGAYGENRLYEQPHQHNEEIRVGATTIPVYDGNYNIILQCLDIKGTTFRNFKFKFQILEGEYTLDTLPKYTPYFSGLKHAFFDSIKSTGRNVFNRYYGNRTGGSLITETTDEKIIVRQQHDGKTYASANIPIENPEQYIGKTLYMSAKWTVSNANKGAIRVMWLNESTGIAGGQVNESWTSGAVVSGVVPERPANATGLYLMLYSNVDGTALQGDTVTYTDIMISTENVPYEPYKDSTFAFPLSIGLKKWDYILPQAQKIVRKTKIVTNPTPFTDEEISQYPNAIVALDKLSLIYEGEETVNELDMPIGYTAWRGGTETVIQGTNDNSAYGAMPTIQTAYANRVYRGVIQCQSKENKRE